MEETSTVRSRLKRAWNIFLNREEPSPVIRYQEMGGAFSYRPDRPRLSRGNERSIVTSIINRMAVDAASITIQHVRTDENGRYLETIKSPLNSCINLSANKDQTGRGFLQDCYLSMFDEGVVAIVPTVADDDPQLSDSYGIEELRTAKIVQWYPDYVRVRLYNDLIGQQQEITLPKRMVGIIENPFYAVMNEQSSTMQRLVRKLAILDAIDEQSGSGKLDLIIQLPYVIKSEARKQQAEMRRQDIERQLAGSKYGIAYTDGTEHITQLNRAVENNLMSQIQYLTETAYGQLGITQSIMDGTADEATMLNYNNRTIEPCIAAVVNELNRKFLTKTARTQRQIFMFFRDPFKLVPVGQVAEIADKFTRNEIMTSNEIRQVIGMKPSKDPKADELRNSNIAQAKGEPMEEEEAAVGTEKLISEEEKIQNGS